MTYSIYISKSYTDEWTENAVILHNGVQVYSECISPYDILIRINIRSEPSLYVAKIGVADAGTILQVYEDLGDWLRILWKGKDAYASHKDFEYIRRV